MNGALFQTVNKQNLSLVESKSDLTFYKITVLHLVGDPSLQIGVVFLGAMAQGIPPQRDSMGERVKPTQFGSTFEVREMPFNTGRGILVGDT